MPTKILHIADVHLDRAFPERGLRQSAAKRRRDLLETFLRTLELADTHDVAGVCVAGDLYEHEHITPDTEATLVGKLGELGRPVLLLPGNHDPYLPGSVYQRADWPANVHVFSTSEPEPHELDADTVIWGMAYTARELREDDLLTLRVPEDGRQHLLLLHASLISEGFPTKPDALPVTRDQLSATGANFVMLGHYHGGRVIDNICYPGSLEPLTWGETDRHTANLLTLDGPRASAELIDVNQLSIDHLEVDVSGAASGVEMEAGLREALDPRRDEAVGLRVELTGEVAPECEVDGKELEERCGAGFAALQLTVKVQPAFDLAAFAMEPTTEGRFVRKLLDLASAEPDLDRRSVAAAHAGLRALHGRGTLIDLHSVLPTEDGTDAD